MTYEDLYYEDWECEEDVGEACDEVLPTQVAQRVAQDIWEQCLRRPRERWCAR